MLQGAPRHVANCLASRCWPASAADEVAQLRARVERDADDPWLRFALGLAELPADPSAAEHSLSQAAESFDLSGDLVAGARARSYLARALERQNRAIGLALIEEVAATAKSLGDPLLDAEVRIQQGRLLLLLNRDFDRVRRLALEAGPTVRELRSCALRRNWLWVLGNAADELGRWDEAKRMRTRLVDQAVALGNRSQEAGARYNLAIALREEWPEVEGSREATIQQLEEARRAALESDYALGHHRSVLLLGKLLDGNDAFAYFDECLAAAERMGSACSIGGCLRARARKLVSEDPAAAEVLWRQALAQLRDCGNPLMLAYAWPAWLEIAWATKPREEATADFQQVLDVIEGLREGQQAAGGRIELFSQWAEAYHRLAGYLLAADEPPAPRSISTAFSYAEQIRSRALLESLSEGRPESPVQRAAAERRRQILDEIVALRSELVDPRVDRDRRQLLSDRLAERKKAEEELAAALGRRDAAGGDFAELEEVQAALGENEALLSFQLGLWEGIMGEFRGGSWLLAITRDDVQVHRLPGEDKIGSKIDMFNAFFPRRDDSWRGPAKHLGDLLLRKAFAGLPEGVDRLILVPDGALHRLPFEVLPDPKSLELGGQGDLLIARFDLEVVPSATLWMRWRQQASIEGRALASLVLADPDFPGAIEKQGPAATRQRQWDRNRPLERLPYAVREADAVRRHLGRRTRVLADAEASEVRLKTFDWESVGLLHLAAHAVLSVDNPARSAVLLAPGSGDEDGLLEPRDILELDLKDRVVILSTCRGAYGSVLRGEGVMSLARAFFQAGARTVIGSLWPLRDDEAAQLFDRFYFHLADGKSVSGALRLAQLDRVRSGAPASAWAGIVAYGDGSVRFVPRYGGIVRIAIAILVLLALFLPYYLFRHFHRHA